MAHSKAALNDAYADLMRNSAQRIAAVEVDEEACDGRPAVDRRVASAELVAHAWLRGRKKTMLSSFVAGTIDQLLFAGLKSRHLALRHLAVAGKVVVIDEAHAYDTYVSAYLDRVLSWLGAYRVPVVVLSATLPAARRRQLAEAHAGAESPAGAEEFEAVGRTDGYSGNLNTSHNRLNTLAQAYSQPGTGLTCDSGLRDDILTGLDHPFRL
ncbi:hypothetical protein [Streptomyces sp. SP17KL33]|uniref:hypothetical protein n=1 Tax=Streptomyces sp. SP17KL33 TaxID=3002534 RepID=UPI003FCD03C1